jgi:hypothetical protein
MAQPATHRNKPAKIELRDNAYYPAESVHDSSRRAASVPVVLKIVGPNVDANIVGNLHVVRPNSATLNAIPPR